VAHQRNRYAVHYNRKRPHRSLELRPPRPDSPVPETHPDLFWAVRGGLEHQRLGQQQRCAARGSAPADRAPDATGSRLRAHIAIGRSQFDQAEQLARSVADHPEAESSPELTCEAFEILGRLSRRTSLHAAEQHFLRVLATAEDHELRVWRARGLHELSTVDLFDSLRTDRAEQASTDAAALGASSLTALADYHLASIHCWRGDYPAARSLLCRAEQVSRALRIPLLAMILIMQAEVAAQHDRPGEIDRLCAEALEHAPDDPHVAAAAHNARATRHLMAEDHQAALRELDAAAFDLRRVSLATTSAPPLGRWVLLATLYDNTDALPAVQAAAGADVARWNIGHFAYAQAITLGRTGRITDAEAAFRRADAAMTHPVPLPHLRHTARRLVAQAAVKDGWGDPAIWLRHDLAYFDEAGHPAIAKTCRALLRAAGGHLTRKTPGPALPSHLRGYGITGREMQILQLVTDGMTNAEIASHLVLSRRTVEKHIENLLHKTQTAHRADLAKLTPADPHQTLSSTARNRRQV
jgi:DNA-binding NarL/FixJ family response regulator